MNPNSSFHVAFNLGYPNAYDNAHNRTGDFLMVHGKCRSAGCYAMTDAIDGGDLRAGPRSVARRPGALRGARLSRSA